MHTENETQKIREIKANQESKDTNWMSYEKAKTFRGQFKEWVLAYRSTARAKLRSNSMNFSTIGAFLPFAFGLFQFLSGKIIVNPTEITSGKPESLLQKTFPVFANLAPKTTTETLQYIIKSNLYMKTASQIDNFGKNMAFLLHQPAFVAIPKRDSLNLDTFTGLSCSFQQNSVSKDQVRFLDELPSYVQSLHQNNLLLESPLFETTSDTLLASKLITPLKENSPTFALATSLTSDNTLQFVSSLLQKETKASAFHQNLGRKDENFFSTDRLEMYQTIDQLENEIQNLFIDKRISVSFDDSVSFVEEKETESLNDFSESSYFSDSLFFEEFSQQNLNVEETLLVDTILQNLENYALGQETPNFRALSGYKYPDTQSRHLRWFYKQNNLSHFFTGKAKNTVNFVPKISFLDEKGVNLTKQTSHYNFRVQKWPSFLIETRETVLKNLGETQSVYKGPTLLLDSRRALDWKNGPQTTHGNLRSWFHTYISPWNPFTQIQDNFIGLSQSSKSVSEQEDFTNKSLLYARYFPFYQRWALVRNHAEPTITPFLPSFHISLESTNKTNRFVRGLTVKDSNNEDAQEQFLPVIQLQQPFFKASSESSFYLAQNKKSTRSFLERGYSPFFDLGITAKPDYIFSAEISSNTLMPEILSSGQYLRRASVFFQSAACPKNEFFGKALFWKTSAQRWKDNWEPLTTQSWLVLSQLSFAVFLFQVLKSLAENYGRELLGYLLDLLASLGFLDDSLKQEIELLLGQRDKGFRVVKQSSKTFTDIVGIEKFLPELYEVVWFLRNSARDFALSHTLPRGILFTGPPGTGKTLLVQSLAGEAKVPVVVLSGSSLIEPGESASVKLEMVFQEARQLAPCIVFIDEIDTLATKRSGVVHSPMGQDSLVDSLLCFENGSHSFFQKEANNAMNFGEGEQKKTSDSEKDEKIGLHQNQQQLSLLTQLLIELDGIQGRDGVVVIGATNRPEVLDPALLRPGRFEKVLQIGLPHQKKRIEILQFYGQTLGFDTSMPWDYLGERTAGFSAADLATLMNESTIKAILNQIAPSENLEFGLDRLLNSEKEKNKISHTVETLEHGIDRLTTSEKEKIKPLSKNESFGSRGPILKKGEKNLKTNFRPQFSKEEKLMMIRLAYYQAGKIIVSSVLEHHPKSIVASLWPRRPTIRSAQIAANLQNSMFEFIRLCEINDRLIGCYGGKAAEFFFVHKFSSRKSSHLSTLGLEDLLFAQKLVYSLIEKSCFYTKKTHIQKSLPLLENLNHRSYAPQKLDLYSDLVETIENPQGEMEKTVELETSSLHSSEKMEVENLMSQLFYSVPWWQQETSNALKFVERNFSNWSRFYLSNPEKTDRNPEWVPPDEFYHTASGLKNVKKAFGNVSKTRAYRIIFPMPEDQKAPKSEKYPRQNVNFSWNGISEITRDYPVHSLVLQSFNKAFAILNQNRELLDRLASELLYHEILRQPEIEKVLQEFQIVNYAQQFAQNQRRVTAFEQEHQVKFLETSWGSFSRKPLPRWLDLNDFSENIPEETT